MAKKKAEAKAESGEEVQEASPSVGRFLYRLALAGVGGVVLAQEELSGLFQKKSSESTDSAESVEESSGSEAQTKEASNRMEATIDRVLHTLNLPTRSDVEDLSQQIEALQARVEALRS